MATYYAAAVVEGTVTPQHVKVEAGSQSEAKKLVEARLGKVKRYSHMPTQSHGKPPVWFKG